MKNVRVWFKKQDECIYISHLDLNRCVLRALHKSQFPIWHTEGFNPHPFATFALPLSLGFVGERESMDIRLLDEEYPLANIVTELNKCLPKGIKVYDATEPQIKPGKIAYASFKMCLTSEDVNSDKLVEICNELFSKEEILIDKKSKKGIKEVDLKPSFVKYSVERQIGCAEINITLPAGSTNNVNPSLICDAIKKYYDVEVYPQITRLNIFNEDFKEFK